MACNYCSNGCYRCNPYAAFNQVNTALKNFKLANPIPDEVSDPDDLRKWFRKNEYIPFAGYNYDSQHTVLRFIDNLATLSPTLGGVINSIGYACFGGKTDIKQIQDFDFDLSDPKAKEGEQDSNEIPIEQKKIFLQWLNTFDLGFYDWSSLKSSAYKSLKNNGNAWLQIDIADSMGAAKVKLTFHPTRNCLYKIPNLVDVRTVAISKSWKPEFVKSNPPVEIPVYPNYEKSKDGVTRTVIHVKLGDNDYYGRPDWWPCSYDAFLEIKNKEYLLKAAHNNFQGQVYFEREAGPGNDTRTDNEDAKKDGFQNAAERFAINFTNEGDNPQRILFGQRPTGAAQSFIHEFQVNTQEKFYESIDKMTTNKIVMVNGWSGKLLGIDESGGLSANLYVDLLKTRMPVIEYWQDIIDNQYVNKAIRFVNDILGKNEFYGFGIESKNPFDHLFKAAQEGQLDKTQPTLLVTQ